MVCYLFNIYADKSMPKIKGGKIPHKILPPCLAKNVYRLFRPEVHFSNRIVFDLNHGEIISVKMPFIKESIDAIC